MKEKLTPDRKAVPSSGGVKDGGNTKLSTPKQRTDNKCPGYAVNQGKTSIM